MNVMSYCEYTIISAGNNKAENRDNKPPLIHYGLTNHVCMTLVIFSLCLSVRYNWDMDDMGVLGMFSYAQFIVGLFVIMMITGK
jgi:hypothetical protein